MARWITRKVAPAHRLAQIITAALDVGYLLSVLHIGNDMQEIQSEVACSFCQNITMPSTVWQSKHAI